MQEAESIQSDWDIIWLSDTEVHREGWGTVVFEDTSFINSIELIQSHLKSSYFSGSQNMVHWTDIMQLSDIEGNDSEL